jgi:hypothetical protein
MLTQPQILVTRYWTKFFSTMQYDFFINTMHYEKFENSRCIRTKGACKSSQMKLEQIQCVKFYVKSIYIDQEGD